MKRTSLFGVFLAFGIIGCAGAARSAPATAPSETTANAAAELPPAVPLPDGMKLLFDGKTLDGWNQDPRHYSTLSGADIADMASFVKKLSGKADAVSSYLAGQLDDAGQTALAGLAVDATDAAKAKVLVKSLNKMITGPSIYDADRFKDVQLSPQTIAFQKTDPKGDDDGPWLNRLLLDDAYPTELKKPSEGPSWIVKDGAIASTGMGRGVLFSQQDFGGTYRIMFDMRHVSGKPDHQACVLIFCTRPADNMKGMDAIGGVQFQVPNGGHWDYRKGKNTGGGAEFTNPQKGKFDIHQWSRVEILVDAAKGTARMAVAQPVGSKAIEVLDFNDPTAGQKGPLALQMHNAGLFDEYANIAVDENPKVNDLITAK